MSLGDQLVHQAPLAADRAKLVLELAEQILPPLKDQATAIDAGHKLVAGLQGEIAADRGRDDDPSLAPDPNAAVSRSWHCLKSVPHVAFTCQCGKEGSSAEPFWRGAHRRAGG